MKVLFTGDFLRPFPDGTPGNQISNVQWLADLMAPCLSFLQCEEMQVVMESAGCSGTDMLRDLGLPCSMDGWLAAIDMPDWSSISDRLDRMFGAGTLIMGFELPRPFKRYLDSKCIPYVDFVISPYRFGDDLFLMADSSDESIRCRMRMGRLVDSDFAKYVGPLKARMRRETKLLAGKNPLVIFGQTEIDRSICRNGVLARWVDHEHEIESLARGTDIIYYKPHPYASPGTTSENIKFFSKFASVVELNEHAYETLVREQQATFLTLSSGVAFEAPYFGKRVTHLLPLPYEIDTDSNSEFSSGFVVLGAAMLSPAFWEHVLTGKNNGPLFLTGDVPENRLRESLGAWWSFENHERDIRLARWANSSRFESVENRMDSFSKEIKSVAEKSTTTDDFVHRLEDVFKKLSESFSALSAKDTDIRHLLDEIGTLRAQRDRAESECLSLRARSDSDAARLYAAESECGRIRRMVYDATPDRHLYRAWKSFVGDSHYRLSSKRGDLKRYRNLNVAWHTHLYRAGLALFVKGEKPWHTHLFRAWKALSGDSKYALSGAPGATPVSRPVEIDGRISLAERFAQAKDDAGV